MTGKSILLVEDNPHDVELARRPLRKNNIKNELVVTRNGVGALDDLFGTGPCEERGDGALPVVILLGLKLPKVDGMEALKRIRAERRTKLLPVVILASSEEERDLVNSYNSGANSYIRKRVDFGRFAEAVRQPGLYGLALNEVPSE